MTFGIIVKRYEHFNRAMAGWDSPKGKWIGSKKQYNEECARQNLVPYEQNQKAVASFEERRKRESYGGLSDKAMSLIQSTKPDKKGRIRLSDRQINMLKEVGAKIEMPDYCPKHYKQTGGFEK